MDGDEGLTEFKRGYAAGAAAERERIRALADKLGAIYDGTPNSIAPSYEEFSGLLYDDAPTAGI